jgi:hypothetical protein
MEAAMDNFENKFNTYKQHSSRLTVSEDFETRVFTKIKKKKNRRKVTASAALFVVIFAFIFIARDVLLHKEPPPKTMTRAELITEETIKEEVPVIEDVIFASSDTQTTYAVEQVSYSEDDDTI